MQKQLVKEGFGYTILPLVSIKNDLGNNIFRAAPINHPDFTREVVLALPNTRHISKLVHTIAQEVILVSKASVIEQEWLGCEWIGK